MTATVDGPGSREAIATALIEYATRIACGENVGMIVAFVEPVDDGIKVRATAVGVDSEIFMLLMKDLQAIHDETIGLSTLGADSSENRLLN